MNQGQRETIIIRVVNCAFMVLAIAIFKPFGLGVWQWQAYLHLLDIFALGIFSCLLTEIILKFVIHMPRSSDRGVNYIISRNLRFQCINTPLVSLLICIYRHFAMSDLVEGNKLSFTNYLETLVIIAFLSFAIGMYWRFKFRSRYLAAELEETRLLNEQLKKLQTSSQNPQETMASMESFDRPMESNISPMERTISPKESTDHPIVSTNHQKESTYQNSRITLEGNTNEHVNLEISDLLYIEAVGNYVKVTQRIDGEIHTHMLRSTMKQMEDTLQYFPMIVRCHRAFMVNLSQVEKISSNSRAMQLIMRHSHDAIPVSRSNVNKLKELLG